MDHASASALRELAHLHDGPYVSVYLDLDPTRFGTDTARESEVASLIDTAVRTAPYDRPRLDGSLDRIRTYVHTHPSIPGARSVAIFSDADGRTFEVLKLQEPVRSHAVVDERPDIRALAALLPHEDWCVLLVNSRTARILRGNRDRFEDAVRISDDVPGRHAQGGWSQARYARHVEQHVRDHVVTATTALFERQRADPFDRLLVACPPELWPLVERSLHPYLRERLSGRIALDVEHATAADVRTAARAAIGLAERREERRLLDRLAERLGTGRGAASGPAAVLAALAERAVAILLVTDGYTARGVRCPSCGWLGTAGTECPADGTTLSEREDIVPDAVRLAVEQHADVRSVRSDVTVAALLRH